MYFKKGLKYISVFLFIFNIISCGLHSGIENSKKELVKSKNQLDSIASIFLNQKNLLAVTRRDYKQVTFGKFINIISPIKTEYNIVGKSLNNNTFRFEVEGDESVFFLKNYETIKSGNSNLKTFLDSQNISYELFDLSRKFLFSNDYYDISVSSTDNAFLIHIGVLDGLLYSIKKGIEVNNPRYEEIIPIGENWYYFKREI